MRWKIVSAFQTAECPVFPFGLANTVASPTGPPTWHHELPSLQGGGTLILVTGTCEGDPTKPPQCFDAAPVSLPVVAPCDMDADGFCTLGDAAAWLTAAPPLCDLNQDGQCNVVDLLRLGHAVRVSDAAGGARVCLDRGLLVRPEFECPADGTTLTIIDPTPLGGTD